MSRLPLLLLAAVSAYGMPSRTFCGEPDFLYPDLVPFVQEDQPWLVNWFLSENRLAVQTVFANVGDGLFQIRSPVESGATTTVYQRVFYGTDNHPTQYEDFPANTAVNFHGGHGHIHFEDFSEFQLRKVTVDQEGRLGVGELVVSEVKTSYSLRDSIRLPGVEWADAISYPSSHQGSFQNVSVGHGDVYSHGTEGQSISIERIDYRERYWLRQIVDPSDVILETDETNNVFEILIDLNVPGETFYNPDGSFVRPGDPAPRKRGDLTLDGLITIADWVAFQSAIGTDLTGLDDAAALLLGDFNLDRLHDIRDVFAFRLLYDEENGVGAFAELGRGGVPEPSALGLMIVLFAGAGSSRMGRR